jgi:hypothetical protein
MGVREGVAAAAIVGDRMRRALRSLWLSNHSSGKACLKATEATPWLRLAR